jgi:hypothetical protein
MNLVANTRSTLSDLTDLIQKLTIGEYTTGCEELGNATIGQHSRHIIELFQCLTDQYASGTINYDLRERNKLIETDPEMAILCINRICNEIELPEKVLTMKFDHGEGNTTIETNFTRELLYNLEHCIHHQALIRVAVCKLTRIQLPSNFGVAPSTLIYRNQCAQ